MHESLTLPDARATFGNVDESIDLELTEAPCEVGEANPPSDTLLFPHTPPSPSHLTSASLHALYLHTTFVATLLAPPSHLTPLHASLSLPHLFWRPCLP